MDMSEIGRSTVPVNGYAAALPGVQAPSDNARWLDVVAQIGAEIAAPLTAALERINTLIGTGRIDRLALRALRDEVEGARQAGITGQQLTRFASGRLRQSHERLHLVDVLNGVLAQRSRETQARGIALKLSMKPAEVIVDAPLLFSLLNSTLDWSLANAHAQIEFTIDIKTCPAHARLVCRFEHRPIDETTDGAHAALPRGLNALTWRLIEQTARTMGLAADRKDEGRITTLTLEFPRTADNQMEGLSTLEINDGSAPATSSQPLAGSHVLVIASRCEMRVQIRDSLRNMSLIIDFVNTVEEAVDFCSEGLPHAIVIESIQSSERFKQFRDEIAAEVPDFVFIEIVEEGSAFELSSFSGTNVARVGRDVLSNSLPQALIFELSKGL